MFETALQQFVYYDKYARFSDQRGRREKWPETVGRVVAFLRELSQNKLNEEDYQEIYDYILSGDVAPSMRLMRGAGKQAHRHPESVFNCAYLPIVSIESITEILWLSMCGVGIGYDASEKYTRLLPFVSKSESRSISYIIEDSTEGWVNALRVGLMCWWSGADVEFDYSQIRPAGAPLKTKGGTASGPGVLMQMMERIRKIIFDARGRQLRPIEVFDIITSIGDAAVSGGSRRCLDGNTLIQTKNGLKKIKDISVGEFVQTKYGLKEVVSFFDQGVQQVYRLTAQNGAEIICTEDHKIAVLDSVFGDFSYKKLKDIEINRDKIVFISHGIDGQDIPPDMKPLNDYREADTIRTEIDNPYLDTTTAWIMGKFLADGCITVKQYSKNGKNGNRTLSFSCNTKEVEQIEFIKQWFVDAGISPNISETAGNWVNVKTGVRRMGDWFSNYKESHKSINVPKEILASSRAIRGAFLAGVFDGDGAAKNRPVVLCATIYKDFALQLQHVYASLGIITEIKLNRPKTKDGWQPLYHLVIKDGTAYKKFRETVLPFSFKEVPERKKYQYGYTYPKYMVKRDLAHKQYGSLYAGNPNGMNSHTLNTAILENEVVTPVDVVSIESVGARHTYDIEVSDEHSFVLGNGFLVHNSAQLASFDFDDKEMRSAKKGKFWETHPNRTNANISVSIDRELSRDEVRSLMMEMLQNGTGEPGWTSQLAANSTRPERRREITHGGQNACSEINLQGSTANGEFGGQTCNLSTVQVYHNDTEESLAKKVRVATIIGSIQSIASDGFTKMLRRTWKEICAEERLLGVSVIGLMDNAVARKPEVLRSLREIAIDTNKEYAIKLGINQSAAICTLKPAGNASVMYGTARGINARYAPYYIRRVRINRHTPIYSLFKNAGLKMLPEVGYTEETASTFVVEFYEKSPDGAITIDDMSAIDQLKMWKNVKLNWCEHNASVTIEYYDHEINDIIEWMYENQKIINGISFLPRTDFVYELAPYQRITKEEYEAGIASFPEIDFNKLANYESADMTISEVECSAGECDLF